MNLSLMNSTPQASSFSARMPTTAHNSSLTTSLMQPLLEAPSMLLARWERLLLLITTSATITRLLGHLTVKYHPIPTINLEESTMIKLGSFMISTMVEIHQMPA